MSEWTPQPESRPVRDPDPPGVVSGVLVCAFHFQTTRHLRSEHMSTEGHARRVAQISAACADCAREQREAT